MSQDTLRRAEICLGEAAYDLREAVKIYQDRYGPIGHVEISAVSQIWSEMDELARKHMTQPAPSDHDFPAETVERMSIAERFELHRTEHLSEEPSMHGHYMDPFSAGLGELTN